MYIRGLIPRNFAELAEAVPIWIPGMVLESMSRSKYINAVCKACIANMSCMFDVGGSYFIHRLPYVVICFYEPPFQKSWIRPWFSGRTHPNRS